MNSSYSNTLSTTIPSTTISSVTGGGAGGGVLVVKTSYGNDLRRFSVLEGSTNWIHFSQTVCKLYGIDPLRQPHKITYKDEEGDDVLIATDEELREAFAVARALRPPTLRLTLTPDLSQQQQHQQQQIQLPSTSLPLESTPTTTPTPTPTPPTTIPTPPTTTTIPTPTTTTIPTPPTTTISTPTTTPTIPAPIPTPSPNTTTPITTTTTTVPTPALTTAITNKTNEPTNTTDLSGPSVVYFAGRTFIPPKVTKQPFYGCTKVPPAQQQPSPPSPPPSSAQRLDAPISNSRALANLTSSICESVSYQVLHLANTTLAASMNASASTLQATQAISAATHQATLETSAQQIAQQQLLSSSLYSSLCSDLQQQQLAESTARTITNLVNDTGKTSSDASNSTIMAVLSQSLAIHDDVVPVSQKTLALQEKATIGLEKELDKDIDEVVKAVMSVTSDW